MLWGWLDTAKDNYPCLAPDFEVCLGWELLEVLFAAVDRQDPFVADNMWNQVRVLDILHDAESMMSS